MPLRIGEAQAEAKVRETEERLLQAEARLRVAEARAQVAEERLELIAGQNAELLTLVERAQESKADGAEEVRHLEQRLAAETARVQELERALRELEAPGREAERAQRVTLIVEGEEREPLKRSVAAQVRRPLRRPSGWRTR